MVREIDALDGLCGRVTGIVNPPVTWRILLLILSDKAGTAFRVLNRSKGPAVWVYPFLPSHSNLQGPRALIDRKLYKKYMRQELDAVENLTLLEGSVADLLITSPDPELGDTKSYGRVQGIALGIDFLIVMR